MALKLDEYRTKLINKILSARSQDEVKRFIEAAMKALEQYNVNGHLVVRFVDKTNSELNLFNPMNKDAQQWSNISMAKIIFNRIQLQLNKAAT